MAKKNKKRRKKYNRGLKFLSTFLTLLIILVSLALVGYNYIIEKFLIEIDYEEIDKGSIGISEDALKVDGVKTVLLLGTDSGDLSGDGRTDVIILASVNTKLKTIKLISIPRDTKVNIKGYAPQKINHAYFYGGPKLMLHTINSNFDLNVDDYALIDYGGVARIVDGIGGIDLELDQDEIDFINSRYMAKTIKAGNIKTSVKRLNAKPGMVHLNGIQAVTHARNRNSLLGDFDRTERQRNIIQAVIKKAENKSINEIMALTKKFLSSVKTSVSKDEILKYLIEFGFNKDQYLKNVKSYQNPSGANGSGKRGPNKKVYEFVPVMPLTKDLFNQYINKE